MSKQCVQCGGEFTRPPNRSAGQWAKMRCCSARCANTQRARRQRHGLTTQQRWATQWERQRRIEDNAELKAWKPKAWPHCKVAARPQPRRFISRVCQACGAMWLSYSAMPDTTYCKPCNRARWRETHYERAARYGVRFDVVDPLRIFERDGWRCQLCGIRVQRSGWPNPKRATLDHIIPFARGGAHTEDNLQCACWLCNSRKGAGSANDQLRLAV